MKFKKEHTAELMLELAQKEADGYIEITLGAGPSKVKPNTRNHVSVTVTRQRGTPHPRITWRRANVEVTRRAINDTLDAWRAM